MFAVFAYFEMKMGTGNATGFSHFADLLSLDYRIPFLHIDLR